MIDLSHLFRPPFSPAHRQYEALRAVYLEGLSFADAARKFGYAPNSLRNLALDLSRHPERSFFRPSTPGRKPDSPTPAAQQRDQRILDLRRQQQLSVPEIVAQLAREGISASKSTVARTLQRAGIPKLSRRSPEQNRAALPRPVPQADRRRLDLSPRSFRTAFGGLFLFAHRLAAIPLDQLLARADWPGSVRVPARCATLALLGLKLFGVARKSHVSPDAGDPGLALFCGLNAIPKRSTLSEYSSRISRGDSPSLPRLWLETVYGLGLPRGESFDLDFHTIPYHGDDPLVQKQYIAKRSRSQQGILAFLARNADARVFCYTNATVTKAEQKDEILEFAATWKDRHGDYPRELVFDSTLTTYENLAKLNRLGIGFLTLRRRTKKVLAAVAARPAKQWKRIRLTNIGRHYRRPRVTENHVILPDYGTRKVRQIAARDLGDKRPILLLTNQFEEAAAVLVDRYVRRMLIENAISDAIDFFHLDALSSNVALKVDTDLDLTLMASTLYRMLGRDLGGAYETARARTLFRKFVQATAHVQITSERIEVQLGRRTHNPLLAAAGYADKAVPIPWLQDMPLQLRFP